MRPQGQCRAVSPPIHSVPCLVVAEEVEEEAVEAGKVEGAGEVGEVGGGWQSSCVVRRMTIFDVHWRHQC